MGFLKQGIKIVFIIYINYNDFTLTVYYLLLMCTLLLSNNVLHLGKFTQKSPSQIKIIDIKMVQSLSNHTILIKNFKYYFVSNFGQGSQCVLKIFIF